MSEHPVVQPPGDSSSDASWRVRPDLADALRDLGRAVDALTGIAVSDVDGQEAAAVAAGVAGAVSRLTAAKVRLLPVIEADGLWAIGGARSFPVWVAEQHDVAIRTARAEVRLGRVLRDHLPQTAAAALTGQITVEHAQVLGTLAPTTPQRREVLADPTNECNEAFLVAQARRLPVDDLRRITRQWAALADPDADDRGYVESCDREHLQISRLGDMYDVAGQLTLDHGQTLIAALRAVTSAPAPDDTRTATQRRAQALADLARLTLDEGLAGGHRSVRPRITVLIDHPTFTQLCQTARTTPTQGSLLPDGSLRTPPCVSAAALTGDAVAGEPQFEDGTPVPRSLLDRLACDSEINRVIFGPQSQVLDVGRAEQTFKGPRRAAIVARDKHCRYPGCTAPPVLCEGHHIHHWARDHGNTAVDEGILLCWHHHSLVHRRGIEIHRRDRQWVFLDRHGIRIGADDEEAGAGPGGIAPMRT